MTGGTSYAQGQVSGVGRKASARAFEASGDLQANGSDARRVKAHDAQKEMSKLVAREGEEQGAAGDAFYAGSLSATARTAVKVGDHEVCCELPISEKLAASRYLLGMAEFLAQQRFGRPLYQIHAEDLAGHNDSSEMMLRILDDGHHLRYGEPIKPPKGKIDHRIL